jgi:hypothetical protein
MTAAITQSPPDRKAASAAHEWERAGMREVRAVAKGSESF